MSRINNIYNFLPISGVLSTSGQPTEGQLRALAKEGYQVVINLALHNDPRYSLRDERGSIESLGMVYVHIPVQFDAPKEEELFAFFHAMETYKDKKIHLHCAANMRVTAFLSLYRLIKQGQPEIDAFEPMRSIWEPDDVWAAFISEMIAKHVPSAASASTGRDG